MCEFFGSSKPFFDEFLEFEVLLSHRHMATRLRSRSQLQQPEIVNERSERPTMSDDFKDRMDEFLRSEKFKEILNVAVSTAVQAAVSCLQEGFAAMVEPFKHEIPNLRRELSEVQIKANDNKQYSRRCNLRFYGIEQVEDEDSEEVIRRFCAEELEVDIALHEIDCAHRVGITQENKPHPIIVKLSSHKTKVKILNRKKLQGREGLFIAEDLTRCNQKLLLKAREKCDVKVISVYSYDGKVLAKRRADNKVVRLKVLEDLNELLS